jgi:predicted RNA binding protein YcfA (HicA-like mRNA interferase family)
MGRLRVLSGREACRILQQHGFVEVRRRGSHVVMQRRTDAGSVTVPTPDHRELAIGTLLSIIRQSGCREWSSRNDLKRVSVA